MTAPPQNPDRRPPLGAKVSALIYESRTLAFALLIVLALRVIVFQPFTIPSASMEPTLLKGDYIVVSKYSYGWSRFSIPFGPPLFRGRLMGRSPERGDVVVFRFPRDESIAYIKRVIGEPGDRVQVIHGAVLVNGAPIPRVRLGLGKDPDMPQVTVAQYRETKSDGRTYLTFARAPEQDADNTGVYVVPPGHYFVMGDNRDNSLDSRWPSQTGVGFVPAENLIGKAQFVLLSWDDETSPFKPWTWFSALRLDRVLHRLQ